MVDSLLKKLDAKYVKTDSKNSSFVNLTDSTRSGNKCKDATYTIHLWQMHMPVLLEGDVKERLHKENTKNNYYQNTWLRCSMFSYQPKSLKASAPQLGSFCILITTMGTTIKLYQSHQNHDPTCGKRWVCLQQQRTHGKKPKKKPWASKIEGFDMVSPSSYWAAPYVRKQP